MIPHNILIRMISRRRNLIKNNLFLLINENAEERLLKTFFGLKRVPK